MSKELAKDIKWDLSDLYSEPQDPKIFKDLDNALNFSKNLESKYKPLLEEASASSDIFPMLDFMKDYEDIIQIFTKPAVFSHLSFAEQTNDPSRGAFMQKVQDKLTDIESHLLFWDVMWCRMSSDKASNYINDPNLAKYHHYLEDARKYAPYTLSESEEKIMSIKSNTSGSAFSRLFDEVVNKIPFFIEENGKKVQKNESEVLALLHSTDRPTRKMGSLSLAQGLEENAHLLTYVFNMILADTRASRKIRGYKHPMDSRNLANETDLETITGLMDAVKSAYPLAQRFYRLKTKLLGLDQMEDYDRYASLSNKEEMIPYDKCKSIVLEGYEAFSKEAATIVKKFFDNNWIDAEIRDGKQGGGFCCDTTPDLHPYILVNYTGNIRDVMTVAHECGHGMHQYLSREAGILESDAPLTMAETASVFGEMLIFDKILQSEKDDDKRLALICGKIDDNFATVFRQIAMTDFELKAHLAGIDQGELSEDTLNQFWIESNAELYGDSVNLSNGYRHGWKYIPHFVHTPFYCYAYAFAQLFVLTLYRKYQTEPQGFVENYFQMLKLGGSKKPEEMASIMGLNIQEPDFWSSGIKLLEELVQKAEDLASSSV